MHARGESPPRRPRGQRQRDPQGCARGYDAPGKLADCSNRDPSQCELYIVEGDFRRRLREAGEEPGVPGHFAAQGEDFERRAGASDKMLANNEIKALIIALGMGVGEARIWRGFVITAS